CQARAGSDRYVIEPAEMDAHRGRHVIRVAHAVACSAGREPSRGEWIVRRITIREGNPGDVPRDRLSACRIARDLGVAQLEERKVSLEQNMIRLGGGFVVGEVGRVAAYSILAVGIDLVLGPVVGRSVSVAGAA